MDLYSETATESKNYTQQKQHLQDQASGSEPKLKTLWRLFLAACKSKNTAMQVLKALLSSAK